MGGCDLDVYSGLDQLWRLIQRYAMTAPISISVVDNKGEYVRAICGIHRQGTGWDLKDETPAVLQCPPGEMELPLTIRVRDAKGNVLKMRLHIDLKLPRQLAVK